MKTLWQTLLDGSYTPEELNALPNAAVCCAISAALEDVLAEFKAETQNEIARTFKAHIGREHTNRAPEAPKYRTVFVARKDVEAALLEVRAAAHWAPEQRARELALLADRLEAAL